MRCEQGLTPLGRQQWYAFVELKLQMLFCFIDFYSLLKFIIVHIICRNCRTTDMWTNTWRRREDMRREISLPYKVFQLRLLWKELFPISRSHYYKVPLQNLQSVHHHFSSHQDFLGRFTFLGNLGGHRILEFPCQLTFMKYEERHAAEASASTMEPIEHKMM